MRKLKLQMQQTVNGFVGGPNGEQDWMTRAPDPVLTKYILGIAESSDCIIMGRKLAHIFIPYWASAVASDPNSHGYELAGKMNDMPKVVFTKTMETSVWESARLAKGDLAEEITALKQLGGGDIIVYGGAEFVSNLIHADLIDEYHLIVNPTAIGAGLTIFKERKNLKLVNATPYSGGKVVLLYQPVR
jgi:dihydrofolate reductase